MEPKKECLVEIYTTSDHSFSVGTVLYEDEDNILFRLLDKQGKWDGFYLFKKFYISSMEHHTEYLKKMELYLEYWNKNHVSEAMKPNSIFYTKPTFAKLIDFAQDANKIITIASCRQPSTFITGYVKEHKEGKVLMECIDMETASIFSETEVAEHDIVFLEIESPDNELLNYAYQHIN